MKFREWLFTEGMKTPEDIQNGDKFTIEKYGNDRILIQGIGKGLNNDLITKITNQINSKYELQTTEELIVKGIGIEKSGGKERQIRIGKWFQKNNDQNGLRWWSDVSSNFTTGGRPLFTTHVNVVNKRNGDTIYVPHNSAQQGWGPFGYDLAIEFATMNNSCVVPATGSGNGINTDDSNAVWKYYYEKRPDVKKEPLEDGHYQSSIKERNLENAPWLYQKYTKQPELISRLKEINEKNPGTLVFKI